MKTISQLPLARAILLLAAMGVIAGLVRAQVAQRPPPHIAYVYPAGGQQGSTFTVSVGGQNLVDANAVFFSDVRISAKVKGYDRPLTQKEINDLREKQQQLQDKRAAALGLPPTKSSDATKPAAPSAKPPPFTAEDQRALADIRAKLASRVNRQVSPALAETVTLEVALAPDTPVGEHELRLKTPLGLSNPFVFCVGVLPEFSRPAVTATNSPTPQPLRTADPRERRLPPGEMEIMLPAVANGQILPGEVNRFHFTARHGARLTAMVSARSLIPYLADAVPGWFQAAVTLYDARGRELAYQDDNHFNPDPTLTAVIPADGDYVLEIKDAIYRGREDFVYRVAIGELPVVTSVFPLGCPPSKPTEFALTGWNLPTDTATLNTANRRAGTLSFTVMSHNQLSNPVRVAVDPQPASREAEPNDRPETAQPVTLPIIVDGHIARQDDVDVFRFDGKKGNAVVAEIFARRLGSPLDSTLKLTDSTGRVLAANDDYDDRGSGLLTHQADSRVSVTLPADDTYYVHVADAQHQGGAEFTYRLRVGAPQPDFALRVVPASLNLRAGGSVPLTVYALRRDGFTGEIALGLHEPPRGLVLNGARIPANQDKVQLTITASANASEEPVDLTLAGSAIIEGRTTTHVAVPAEDMMQAFAYHHLVPARELKAAVVGRGAPLRVMASMPVKIPAGGQQRIRLAVLAPRALTNLRFELSEPVDGLKVSTVPVNGEFVDAVISCDAAKIKPGLQGNLLLTISGERANPAAPKNAARPQRTPLGVAPAIPFEIVAPPPSAKPPVVANANAAR